MKCVELNKKLFGKLKLLEQNKIEKVSIWLWTKARVLHKEVKGSDVSSIKTHVIVRFLREYNIKRYNKQRNQKISKEDKISDLKQ